TPATILAEDCDTPHTVNPPGPTDAITSVLSAVTQAARVSMAESMPRRLPDDRQAFQREQRRPRGPAGPADQSERPVLLGTEQEPNRHQQTVEPRRLPPSEHSHSRSEALPSVKPKTSRLARPIAPLRPHTAALPVVSTRYINNNELPVHIQSRMTSLQRLSELLQDDRPREQLGSKLVPIREGDGGGDDPPSDNSSYFDSSNEYDSWRPDPTRRLPNKPGEDPNRESGANEDCVQSFRHAPVHFRTKLSPEIIPEWNGNTTELSNWIVLINNIAEY
ncbi:hypothetical protein FRC11_002128, partial [Ceratobasidium sp. 423]